MSELRYEWRWRAPSGVRVVSSVPRVRQGGLLTAWSYAFRKYLLGHRFE